MPRAYLYCIIKEKNSPRFNILGQEGKEIYTINEGPLAMVVSEAEIKEYPLSREYLLCHQRVIEGIMKQGYDVLPLSFGTLAESVKVIKQRILKQQRKELLEQFRRIKGKIELVLRAIWKDMPSIFQEIVAENKVIQIAKKKAQKAPSQFRVAAVGELVATALASKKENEAKEIFKPLKEIAVDFKERALLGDSMLLNSAFLVPKNNEKEFDKRVQCLVKRYGQRIKFFYIGPAPPSNFVGLNINLK